MSISALTALAIVDPDRARTQIEVAMREACGNRTLAARILGIPLRTLYRVAERLNVDLGPQRYVLRDTDVIAKHRKNGT